MLRSCCWVKCSHRAAFTQHVVELDEILFSNILACRAFAYECHWFNDTYAPMPSILGGWWWVGLGVVLIGVVSMAAHKYILSCVGLTIALRRELLNQAYSKFTLKVVTALQLGRAELTQLFLGCSLMPLMFIWYRFYRCFPIISIRLNDDGWFLSHLSDKIDKIIRKRPVPCVHGWSWHVREARMYSSLWCRLRTSWRN